MNVILTTYFAANPAKLPIHPDTKPDPDSGKLLITGADTSKDTLIDHSSKQHFLSFLEHLKKQDEFKHMRIV